jgi:hypothetical protein
MAIPIKKKVKVLEADYIKEADCILIIGECSEGRLRHQIHSSCFIFGNKNKEEEMKNTAKLMIGKTIFMVFDTELDGKIKDHEKLKY